MPICFQCGKALVDAVRRQPVKGVERTVDGRKVRMHVVCADTFDETYGDANVTARPKADPGTGSGEAPEDAP
jgi:hypothetical protein